MAQLATEILYINKYNNDFKILIIIKLSMIKLKKGEAAGLTSTSYEIITTLSKKT